MTIPPSTSRRATDPVLIGLISELRYKAFGETRYSSGDTPTTFRYTGQREEEDLGLYYYRARWYDPRMGRFVSADTIVPGVGNPQALNRYGYVNNNPIKFTDPSGHYICEDPYECDISGDPEILIRRDLWNYGIAAAGLSLYAREQLVEAAELHGGNLFTLFADSPWEAFTTAVGGVEIIINPELDLDVGNCITDGHVVTCMSAEDMTVTGILHEYWHVFDKNYEEIVGNPASNNIPYAEFRVSVGYICGDFTCLEHDPGAGELGHHLIEELADMGLNYTLHGNNAYPNFGFTEEIVPRYSPWTRLEWMDMWLPTWLTKLGD